jgi:hypothetical protein
MADLDLVSRSQRDAEISAERRRKAEAFRRAGYEQLKELRETGEGGLLADANGVLWRKTLGLKEGRPRPLGGCFRLRAWAGDRLV